MQARVEMVHVGRAARCACGEDLRPGERAGQLDGNSELVCLWCLADLQAGRERPRRRRVETPWPEPATAARSPRRGRGGTGTRRRRRADTAVPLVVALLVVAAALYVHLVVLGKSATSSVVAGAPISGGDVPSWINGTAVTGGRLDTSALWPPTPPDARTQPIGTPGVARSSSTDYVFMHTIPELDGQPVAWDPCRPIHLVVNNADAPPGADQLIREAVASVSSATGLQFVIDGTTTETPTDGRGPRDKAQYGDRWSPVLVAWTNPSVIVDLQGRVAGLAGPAGAPYYTAPQQHWVSGTVSLDGPQFREVLQRTDGWANARAIVMHEFAHLVGLNHASQRSQLMYADNIGQRAFGAGDLEGLRRLGLGRCFTG